MHGCQVLKTVSNLQVVWFKRDLRVEDHRPLSLAARSGAVLPLYVVEPDLWQGADMSGRQWAFISESLQELRTALAELGQPLVIRTGSVTAILDDIHREFGIAGLWSHQETGNAWTFERDKAVAAWCRANSVPWREERQGGTIRTLKSRNGWAKHWDAFMGEPVTAPPPLAPVWVGDPGGIPRGADLGLAPDPCPDRQAGGRKAGRERLDSFLNSRAAPYRKAMSSPDTGFDHCSRLSPHLAWGTLAMREVAQATRARQRALKASPQRSRNPMRAALVSFSGRLHWHCHFMQKLEDQPALEFRNLHPAYEGLRPASPDRERLEAWEKGETGLPFVDACMRALRDTGWMNFRMRAMLMAVASYHLWLDWRRPGEHLARLFTDYEPGIHWPQVQMQSGTTGINTIRIYNPVKQGHDQDPDGVFIRRYVPELAGVSDAFLHEPWKDPAAAEFLGSKYPFPIVDHLEAAKTARRRVWSVRAGKVFRSEADRIQEKHGSRRSGIASPARRRKSGKDDQLSLALSTDETP